jgi:tetratricopeptide (TPR) repeat protein
VPSSSTPSADDDLILQLPHPLSPNRAELQPGQDPASSGIHHESSFLTSDANTRATDDVDTPEDQRLATLAQQDHDFFQTLDAKPDTWPDTERDRRAQAINDAYLKYLDDLPDNLNALILYGKFLRHVGEYQQSYFIFQRAHRVNPNVAVVNQQLGNYLAETGQYTPALGFFLQAVALDPKEPLYHYQLGELLNIYYDHYLQDKIYTEDVLNRALLGEFNTAAQLDPAEPGYAWRAAEAYYDVLDPDWNAALAAWDALAKRTTSPVELQVIRLHRARIFLELNRNADARPLLALPVRPGLEATRKELLSRLAAQTTFPSTPTPASPTSTTITPASNITPPSTSNSTPPPANLTTPVPISPSSP